MQLLKFCLLVVIFVCRPCLSTGRRSSKVERVMRPLELSLVHVNYNLSEILQRDRIRVATIYANLHRNRMGKISSNDEEERKEPESDFKEQLPLSSGATLGTGEYLVKLGIGTPVLFVYLVMDTGSDVTWLQCNPCFKCFLQTDPIFSPVNSSSYEAISCTSALCQQLSNSCEKNSSDDFHYCSYRIEYLDQSFSSGALSKEVFTLTGDKKLQEKIVFGCGNNNVGLFTGYSGLLGMGGGPISFISQLPQELGRSFSYCMVDRDTPVESSSPLYLGSDEASPSAVSIPLLSNPRSSTHYFTNMDGIRVNGVLLDIPASLLTMNQSGSGGIVIDSGTTLTHLPLDAYSKLRAAFVGALGEDRLLTESVVENLDCCFFEDEETANKVPDVVLEFDGNARMELPRSNVVVRMARNEGKVVSCLAFVGLNLDFSILGNVQQQTIRMGFNLEKRRIVISAPGVMHFSCSLYILAALH